VRGKYTGVVSTAGRVDTNEAGTGDTWDGRWVIVLMVDGEVRLWNREWPVEDWFAGREDSQL
jgi:hypothetical protein